MRMLKSIVPSVALLFSMARFAPTAAADPKIVERTIEYKEGNAVLEGFLAMPAGIDAKSPKHPGIVVVHEWMGLNDYAKRRARMLAELGYIAFAADIYGKGVRPKDPKEAGELAGKYKSDRPLLRKRAQAALDELAKQSGVDTNRLAAIGYCFGGTTVLELARSGAPLVATVSFHGALATPTPADAKNIKGKVLALHGADDPTVPAKEVEAFEQEMRDGHVNWELVKYGGAVHAFTNPATPFKPGAAVGYNESADKRSWQAMKDFFGEVF